MKRLIPILLLPSVAFAEVMDKEFSLGTVGAGVFLCTLFVFVAARYRPAALVVALPIAAWFFLMQLSEITDRWVGPTISSEAGHLYVWLSWSGPVFSLFALCLGLWRRNRVLRARPVA